MLPAADTAAGGPPSAAAFSSWAGAGAAVGGSAEMERTALERMRMSINNLSDFNLGALAASGAWRCGGGGGAVDAAGAEGLDEDEDEDAEFDAADEAEAEVAAYWGRQKLELRRAASGQVQGAAAGGGADAAPDSARAAQLLPADPFDQEGECWLVVGLGVSVVGSCWRVDANTAPQATSCPGSASKICTEFRISNTSQHPTPKPTRNRAAPRRLLRRLCARR